MNARGLMRSEVPDRLEQGRVERVGIFDLRNMAEPRKDSECRPRQALLQIARLLDRRNGILFSPDDRDGNFQPRVSRTIGALRGNIGACEVIEPVRDVGRAATQVRGALQNVDIFRKRALLLFDQPTAAAFWSPRDW